MADGSPIKIVLVEDEPAIQVYTKTLLKTCNNADVYATDNPQEAIKLVKELKPALIVQDLWLKGASLNGWDCIRSYRTFNDDVKIIITSADMRTDGPNDIQLLARHAVSATIEKPYSPEKFKNIVMRVLNEEYNYVESAYRADSELYVKVSPELQSILHTVKGLLSVVKNRCEHYWLDYSTDPFLVGSNPQEITKKALKSLKECSEEIDCIADELEKIKFVD